MATGCSLVHKLQLCLPLKRDFSAVGFSFSFGRKYYEGVNFFVRFLFALAFAEMFDPFLAVADLIGEGRVDLNVRFTFSLIFQVFHGGIRDCRARFSWIGDKPLETESSFALAGTGEIPFSSVGEIED